MGARVQHHALVIAPLLRQQSQVHRIPHDEECVSTSMRRLFAVNSVNACYGECYGEVSLTCHERFVVQPVGLFAAGVVSEWLAPRGQWACRKTYTHFPFSLRRKSVQTTRCSGLLPFNCRW